MGSTRFPRKVMRPIHGTPMIGLLLERLANAKLVDEIGGEAEAVSWLESARGVPKKLKVVDWKPHHDDDWGVPRASVGITGRGLTETAVDVVRALGRDTRLDTLTLDGLVSVWHQSEK